MEDEEMEDESSTTVKIWAVVALLLSFPVDSYVSGLFDPGRGRAAGIAFGLLLLATRAYWRLRWHVWYWLTIAVLVAIHVVLVIEVPWSNRSIPAPALWPIGTADFAMIYGFIALVDKLLGGDHKSSSSNENSDS